MKIVDQLIPLLSEKVMKADIGIALDGDGDRIIISDENGHIVDGDQILGLLSLDLKNKDNNAK